jgi:hypothetical protein
MEKSLFKPIQPNIGDSKKAHVSLIFRAACENKEIRHGNRPKE